MLESTCVEWIETPLLHVTTVGICQQISGHDSQSLPDVLPKFIYVEELIHRSSHSQHGPALAAKGGTRPSDVPLFVQCAST